MLHMIKLAVGVEDFDHLAQLQQNRIAQNVAKGLSANPRHITRMVPRRQKALLDGGSIYWVIKGAVRARQELVAFEEIYDEEGTRRCAIVLDPKLIPTRATPHRAFQGWRYLEAAKAPPDSRVVDQNDLPAELAADLEALGLL